MLHIKKQDQQLMGKQISTYKEISLVRYHTASHIYLSRYFAPEKVYFYSDGR